MSSYLNIIIAPQDFINIFSDVITENNVFSYWCYWNELEKKELLEQVDFTDITEKMKHDNYRLIFFSSKKIDTKKQKTFYDDAYFNYAIECKGGRETETEIEILRLRIISKKPNEQIKIFFKQLFQKLKNTPDIGKGVRSGIHLYNDIFYYKNGYNKIIYDSFIHKNFGHPYEIVLEKPY